MGHQERLWLRSVREQGRHREVPRDDQREGEDSRVLLVPAEYLHGLLRASGTAHAGADHVAVLY